MSDIEYPSLAQMAKMRNKHPKNQKEQAMKEDDQNS